MSLPSNLQNTLCSRTKLKKFSNILSINSVCFVLQPNNNERNPHLPTQTVTKNYWIPKRGFVLKPQKCIKTSSFIQHKTTKDDKILMMHRKFFLSFPNFWESKKLSEPNNCLTKLTTVAMNPESPETIISWLILNFPKFKNF